MDDTLRDRVKANIFKADILIVDDTPENLQVLSTMLSHEGYGVRKAINGRIALMAVQAVPPDLILLDIMMPDLDGYEVCRQIKANPQTANIPVIFLSALDASWDKVKAFNAGGVDYITKPFHFDEVLARVKHHLTVTSTEQRIRFMNAQLERRVEERTRQLRSANTQLLKLALHDSLTGLANRRLFIKRLEQSIRHLKTEAIGRYAVLFLDCDRFKVVNDSLGHLIGDDLLIAIAHRLKAVLAPHDLLARLGGDEFAVLLPEVTSAEQVTAIAQHLLQTFAYPFMVQGHEIFITASIGIALSSETYDKPEQLLRDADTAMYQAKARGKAQYRVFQPSMHDDALRQMQLETDLRRAVHYQEFVVYYQPIVALNTRQLTGFEALVRWQHPTQGLLKPKDFISVAEDLGLIQTISDWVLWQSCYQLRCWQQQGLVADQVLMGVNLSARQFSQQGLIERIETILQETNLPPCCLKLELTESVIMDNEELAARRLKALRDRSIQISIDDFGTGYSSLSYLHFFPVDNLKIDRSFVKRLGQDTDGRGLVPTIVSIARTMGMKVIAEGIETPEQLEHLQALNCDFGQGYLFSRPLSADATTQRLISASCW